MENLLMILLIGCDMVLGNDWKKKHNLTMFDHERKCVSIRRKPNKLVLTALVQSTFQYAR